MCSCRNKGTTVDLNKGRTQSNTKKNQSDKQPQQETELGVSECGTTYQDIQKLDKEVINLYRGNKDKNLLSINREIRQILNNYYQTCPNIAQIELIKDFIVEYTKLNSQGE